MWYPCEIEINNLFSNRYSKYSFQKGVCTIIVGKNKTDKNLKNNGAGKSTIFEAIGIALTGDSLRPIKKDFINNSPDVKSCKIILLMKNDVNKKEMKIEREFFKGGKSSTVKVFCDGVLNGQLFSVAEANKYILETLGLTRDDIIRYYIISQDNRYNFFTASDSDKKEILNRITNANMINSIIEKLALDIKAKQSELDDEKNNESKLLGKLEIIDEQEKKVLEGEQECEDIDRLERKRKNLVEVFDYHEKLKKHSYEKLSEFQNMLKSVKRIEVSELINERKILNKKYNSADGELLELNKILKKIILIIDGVIECPKCKTKFVLENEIDVTYDEAVELKNDLDKKIKKKQDEIKKYEKQIYDVNNRIKEANEKNNKIDDLESKVKIERRKIEECDIEIERCKNKIKGCDIEINEIKNGDVKRKRLKELNEDRVKIQKQLNEIVSVFKKTTDELDMLKFWQYNMGRSGFQTYLANKSIKMLEGTINSFLKKMNIDYRLQIDPYKVLKSGDVRDKIECFVSSNGSDWKNFMTYSGGERQRIILAGIFSIQKLINDSLGENGCDMLLLDESLGNIETDGTMDIVNIIGKIGTTTMLITQNIEEPQSIFKNYLLVEKVDGVSRFVQS